MPRFVWRRPLELLLPRDSKKPKYHRQLMHRALFILEILVEIFKFSDFNLSWYHRSRKTLAALARTCKTFHDPAMDLLWADMDNLQPLFGCVTRLHPMIYGGVPNVSVD
jgi:hypothetical protein